MKRQALALFLGALVAASACGIAYSMWNDVIEIHGTMEFGTLTLRFVEPLACSDNEDSTDVGHCTCLYADPDPVSGGFEGLVVSLVNGYPGYEATGAFTIENVGSLPDHVVGIDVHPGAGLVVGEIYLDEAGEPVDWRLDDSVTGAPVLQVSVYRDAGSSLVSSTVDPGDILNGEISVLVDEGAEQGRAYGFGVEIWYD